MTPTHRPLSSWISFVAKGSGRLSPVNAGCHRSDAREMSCFLRGWRRVAVPVGDDRQALGLANEDGGLVVELDDFGTPIVVSAPGLAAVRELEERWPQEDERLIEGLREESLSLRYWVLERLNAEGTPSDGAFAVLPWSLLDDAIDAVAGAFEPGGGLGELVEVRHWLTPAVHGLSGSLEQLDYGLRTSDAKIARTGASALLTRLAEAPVQRVPERSRARLSRLVRLLGIADPLYRHASRVALARLRGEEQLPTIRTTLTPSMERAASWNGDVRQLTTRIGDDDLWVRVTKFQSGRARITAHVSADVRTAPAFWDWTDTFLPVWLFRPGEKAGQRYWIALYEEADELVGSIEITIPKGRSRVVADAAPVGVDGLSHVRPIELFASWQVGSALSKTRWTAAVEDVLDEHHPLRIARRESGNAF